MGQAEIIECLKKHKKPMLALELAEKTGVTLGNINRAMKSLLKQGVVTREEVPVKYRAKTYLYHLNVLQPWSY